MSKFLGKSSLATLSLLNVSDFKTFLSVSSSLFSLMRSDSYGQTLHTVDCQYHGISLTYSTTALGNVEFAPTLTNASASNGLSCISRDLIII